MVLRKIESGRLREGRGRKGKREGERGLPREGRGKGVEW
jgi:hypothetical protein